MSDVLLKIDSLSASYGDVRVVSDISFELRRGEILCIVGESGSGKSTLIKAIHGFGDLTINSGTIQFDGSELTGMSSGRRRGIMGTGIGLIPQNPAGSFNPIRRYDRQFREALSGHGMQYDERKIAGILSSIGIENGKGVLGSRPYELSGGMNQRIAIAAAMMFEPDLLLCDEATSALDVTTANAVVSELLRIRENNGTAILMVTHNLGIAKRMADNIGIMKSGKLIEYGRADRIFGSPESDYTKRLIRDVPKLKR